MFKICFLFLLFSNVAVAQAPRPVIIGKEDVSYFQKDSWQLWKTPDSASDLEAARNAANLGQFQTVGEKVYNGGIPSAYHWFRFRIRNQQRGSDDILVEVQSPRINRLALYEWKNGRAELIGRAGDTHPFGDRTIRSKNFVFNTRIERDAETEYLLYVDQVGHTLILPLAVYTEAGFQREQLQSSVFDGLINGVFLFVSLLALLFFISTRQPLYLYYSLYIGSSVLWVMGYFGLGFQYFWGNYPVLNVIAAPLLASFNVLLNVQICQILLRLKDVAPAWNRLANLCKVLLCIAGLFPIFVNLNNQGYALNNTYLTVFLIIILLSVAVTSTAVILYSIQGSLVARVYLAAGFLKLGAIMNLALLEFGFSPGMYELERLLQAGIMVEMTLLSFALARRYTLFKEKTVREVIQVQEQERQKMAREIHDSISNSLSALKMAFNHLFGEGRIPAEANAKEISRIRAELTDVHAESRYLSHYMSPDYIRQQTLSELSEKFIGTMQEKARQNDQQVPITYHFSSNEQKPCFSEEVKLNIFRIVQEIVSNTIRHSAATKAELLLSFDRKDLTLIAEDNGKGFDLASALKDGSGLLNMQSRIRYLNGQIDIRSSSNDEPQTETATHRKGTMIIVRIPYKRNYSIKTDKHEY